jgi:Zn-dependent protease
MFERVLYGAPPILFAVVFHELAHGWVARYLGDPTAAKLGRLSPNPIRHIDPIGTILVPGFLLATAGVVFGWAKPVPVDIRNLRKPRRDMALVAVAGPLANLAMLAIWAGLYFLISALGTMPHELVNPLVYMCLTGIIINSVLMLLNLLPIPPLDGSRVLAAALPPSVLVYYERIEPFGLIIVLALLLSGLLDKILKPALAVIARLLL